MRSILSDALETYGADAIRWYFYVNSGAMAAHRFHGKAVREGQRKFYGYPLEYLCIFSCYMQI